MKTTTMTAALLALTLAGAGETAAADAIINEFTAQNLSEVLGEIGGTDIAPKTDQDGITTVSAKTASTAPGWTRPPMPARTAR
jgi:hypothetical protein